VNHRDGAFAAVLAVNVRYTSRKGPAMVATRGHGDLAS
jgi:hypothetical protein